MSKKILSTILSLVLTTSLIGCGSKTETGSSENTKAASVGVSSEDSEDSELTGEYAEDKTLDGTKKLYNEKLEKIKNITKQFGIKYSTDNNVKTEKNVTIHEEGISFDNENAEANKIQSMSFGLKVYGDDSESGVITLKLLLNFDSKNALKNNDFDLGKTSFAKYIEAFTGESNRDYSDINKQILDGLKNNESEVSINNTINGLKEEIIASDDCIFYKLSTKKYIFKDAEMSMD